MTGTKVRASSTETSQPQRTGSTPERQAEAAEAERFRNGVRSAKNTPQDNPEKEQKRDTETHSEVQLPAADRQTAGDAILRGLHQQRTQPQTAGAPQKADFDTAQNIVDRILVSTHTADGSNEIRIQLKEDILQGTEIRLVKNEGHLSIALVTNDSSSHAFLASHKHTLQEQLYRNISGSVDVQLIFEEQGEPQDGRSRQQRNLYDELENS